jgi:hypoxanthine phosphoribosyltransferase
VTDPRPVGAEPLPPLPDRDAPPPTREPGSEPPAFAHASEAELSRILDFYAVRWAYEPHVFPILWNTDGDVLESFAPDFYLPDLDLYVELTTLRQKLVRKKNRKLRRLRELYPDVRIKLFYARDFRALMLKYGRFALADELSGTPGQVTPDRSYEELVAGRSGPIDEVPATVTPTGPDGSAGIEAGPVASAATRRRRRRRTTLARQPAAPEAAATER